MGETPPPPKEIPVYSFDEDDVDGVDRAFVTCSFKMRTNSRILSNF